MANTSGFFDAYGNWWAVDHTQVGSGANYTLQAKNITSGTITSVNRGASVYNMPSTPITFDWNVKPTVEILSDPEVLDKLISRMVTLYKPEDPLVICVEKSFTSRQVRELVDVLNDRNIKAVVIPGAHAGTGRPIFRPVKPERERIDILARIGEVWERHPEMTLTELLSWWHGEEMDDDMFAAAVDVYMDGAA